MCRALCIHYPDNMFLVVYKYEKKSLFFISFRTGKKNISFKKVLKQTVIITKEAPRRHISRLPVFLMRLPRKKSVLSKWIRFTEDKMTWQEIFTKNQKERVAEGKK